MTPNRSIQDVINDGQKEINELYNEINWIDNQVKLLGHTIESQYYNIFWDKILSYKNQTIGLEELYEIKNCIYEKIIKCIR